MPPPETSSCFHVTRSAVVSSVHIRMVIFVFPLPTVVDGTINSQIPHPGIMKFILSFFSLSLFPLLSINHTFSCKLTFSAPSTLNRSYMVKIKHSRWLIDQSEQPAVLTPVLWCRISQPSLFFFSSLYSHCLQSFLKQSLSPCCINNHTH